MSDSDWFVVRPLESGVYLVAEPMHVNSYLMIGSERSVLVDTGLGIADVRRAVAPLAPGDVSVVNSHYHFDHVGGNHRFDERLIHEAGVELLRGPVPAEWLRAYLEWTREMLAGYPAFAELDRRYYQTVDLSPRPLPGSFRPEEWRIAPPPPTGTLADGDVVDLGSRSLRVIHSPGHTADSICLLDETAGILIGGDTINTGQIYVHDEDASLEDYARSTARLAEEVGDAVRTVFMMHGARYSAEGGYLREVARAAERVAAGEAELRPARDVFGVGIREADFGRFSITVPAEATER